MNPRKRIVVDMDGVLADLMQVWVDIVNKEFQLGLSKNDLIQYEVDKVLKNCGLCEDELKMVFKLFDVVRYKDVPEDYMCGAIRNIMNKLSSDEYEFVVYTKTMGGDFETAKADKLEWLGKHLPMEKVSQVVFERYDRTLNRYQEKKIVADIMIDDNPHTLELFLELNPDSRGILISQPWNAYYTICDQDMVRVSDDQLDIG